MGRSKWKGPYTAQKCLKTLKEFKKNYKKIIIARNISIVPKFINKVFKVHNGKKYIEINVTEPMVGYKFGEFSATRKRFIFKKQQKQK